jgi:indolepyruvate ferredoxin oxidoreductase beta subunit
MNSGEPENGVVNVVVAGLGGQGVVKATDIVAGAAFRAGLDVKKSEIHGMSQRGGSVASDIRFGRGVLSPMVPEGEADFLVIVDASQLESNRRLLRPGGILLSPGVLNGLTLANKKSLNVALVGVLSAWLDIPEECWVEAIRAELTARFHEVNLEAFRAGREAGAARKHGAQS